MYSLQKGNTLQWGILYVALNFIRWFGSISPALMDVQYLFIAITPKLTRTWNGNPIY